MTALIADMGLALWLGILSSLSPCPLATNVTAISFLARQVSSARAAALSGVCYALGRTTVYVLLGVALVSASASIPTVSMFLQRYMNLLLGPVLVVVGVLLLGLFSFSLPGPVVSEQTSSGLAKGGLIGSFALGVLFALAFCPISAAMFFGSTIGIAARRSSHIVMPMLFGLGTAAPVILFAAVVAFSAQAVGKAFNLISAFEKVARRISGAVFVVAGAYLTLVHNFHLL